MCQNYLVTRHSFPYSKSTKFGLFLLISPISRTIIVVFLALVTAAGIGAVLWKSGKLETQLLEPASTASLVPHKAIYSVALYSTRNTSQISNIGGQMFYAIRKSCEGWITQNRFNLVYEYPDSPAMRLLSDFSNVESADGETLQFITRRRRDGELFEELRGEALQKDKRVVFSMPEGEAQDIPAQAIFPIAHTKSVIDAAKSGKKIVSSVLFDGSDINGAVEINTIIAGQATPTEKSAYIREEFKESPLIKGNAWKLRMAFFPMADEDSPQSDYEMTALLYENGVISHMIIDYDDFSIEQKLMALEPLEADQCGGGANAGSRTE